MSVSVATRTTLPGLEAPSSWLGRAAQLATRMWSCISERESERPPAERVDRKEFDLMVTGMRRGEAPMLTCMLCV